MVSGRTLFDLFGVRGDGLDEQLAPTAGYFATHSAPRGFERALAVVMRREQALCGVAGVERRAAEPAFSPDERELLAALTPLILCAQDAERCAHQRAIEATALRAMGNLHGSVFVVDLDERKLVCASPRGPRWSPRNAEKLLVSAAEGMLANNGDPFASSPLGGATVASIATMSDGQIPGHGRCAALHVVREQRGELNKLSARERQVASLLASGFSHVNIGAQCGLSTNTVRTYMRRLYRKLGVFNRADLVRTLLGVASLSADANCMSPLACVEAERVTSAEVAPKTIGREGSACTTKSGT
jgi:DNA-binding CsgD family transcriptional regulator